MPQLDATEAKELGAFYTPPEMAQRLVDWAIRAPGDRVFDPSFGGLVFLDAAHRRLKALRCSAEDSQTQIFGSEVDPEAHSSALAQDSIPLLAKQIELGDFFDLVPGRDIPACDAVVGNPPYIRYQAFNGSSGRAHELARGTGVKLSRLAWR